ncbi:MAG: carboxypeptidase-like regulatory domain-containing protein [Myxococcota bacterium]
MNHWRAVCAGGALSGLALSAFSCSDSSSDDSDNPGSGLPAVTAIMGQAVSTSGSGIDGVIVRGGGAQATTGAEGKFQLDAAAGDDVVVTFEKDGYMRGIKRVDVQDGTPTALVVTLMAEAAPVDLDAEAGGTAAGERGAWISAPPSAFVDGSGTPVAGTVQVHLTPLDPAVTAELDAYPGDLSARQSDGAPAQLETYGVLDITVRQDGEELQIDSGKSIDIRIPAPSSGVSSPPATVALWSFDDDAGVWVEEGEATYNADEHTYDSTIEHLSPWNADVVQDSTCVRGKVIDSYGNPIPGAQLQGRGVDYLGWSSATAGNDGEFCIVVRKGSSVEITAIHPLGGGAVRTVSSTSADTTFPPNCSACSDGGTWVVEQGQVNGPGGSVDCSTIDTAYSGTCAEGLMDIFTCFNPDGACTYNVGTGTLTYENGATMMTSGSSGTLMGPDGSLCGSFEMDASNTSNVGVMYTNPAGQTWTMWIKENNDQVIECPNGETVTITSAQATAIQACSGTQATEQCEVVGGGQMPTPCDSQDDCADGEVCCLNHGYCFPDYPGICDGGQ